jgi:chromosome segregation ATPase
VVPAVAGEPVTWSIITLRIACGGLMVLGGGAFAQTYIWRPYRDLDKEEKALRVDLETERKLDAQESTNVQQLRAELKESQAQLQARQAEVTSMERVLQDTQARLKEIQGALAQTKAVQQAQDGLQKRLDDSGAVLAADLRGLNSVSHDLGAQLTVLREQVSAVDRADRAASTELAQLRSQVEQYEKSITALREAMEKQQAGYEALMNGQRAATAASQSVAATAHAIDGDRQRMEQLEHEVHDSLLPLGEVQALTAQLRSLVDSAKKDA